MYNPFSGIKAMNWRHCFHPDTLKIEVPIIIYFDLQNQAGHMG